jgi:hypothetical protein
MNVMEVKKQLESKLHEGYYCQSNFYKFQFQTFGTEIVLLSGFHQVALRSSPNGLWLKELKEYSDSYLTSDYIGPVLGSKCLVMQTLGNYVRLRPSEETSESMFQVATRTFNLLYCFPFMLLIGLTSLASIYSQAPVLF